MDKKDTRAVYYNKNHDEIVRKGISSIEAVLDGTNTSDKESLLLCLDKYFDPWFGLELPDKEKVEELLQRVILNENTIGVKEDALHLLTSYSWPPFDILQNNLDRIEPELYGNVLYAINMDKDISSTKQKKS